jgi:hypothetical protein
MDPGCGEKLKIDGIKLSAELVQINLLPGEGYSAARLFRELAGRRINMPLVTLDAASDRLAGACCIAAEDLARAQPVLEAASGALQVLERVGSLTVFPHRARFDLFECMLLGFARRGLPVYAIASSLAALTFTTDYGQLDEAAAAVLENAVLPENHAPFRPEFKVRQI